MGVKDYALLDLIDVYGEPFTNLYHEKKALLLETLGIEKSQRVRDVTYYLNRKAREVHKGIMDYFDENENLVAILESSTEQPTKMVRSKEVAEKTEILQLAVQQQAITYIFMYKFCSNGGQKNDK